METTFDKLKNGDIFLTSDGGLVIKTTAGSFNALVLRTPQTQGSWVPAGDSTVFNKDTKVTKITELTAKSVITTIKEITFDNSKK